MDGELHFSVDLLTAYAQGHLTIEQVLRSFLWHVEGCPTCAAELARVRREAVPPESPALALLARGSFRISSEERRQAERELEELSSIPVVEERFQRAGRAYKRFRSAYLAELLVSECWGELARDPAAALEYARLATLIARRSQERGRSARAREVEVLTVASEAAALKALGNLGEAGRLFIRSRELSEEIGLSDIRILAAFDWLEGSYLKDIQLYDRAEELLRRSVRLYELSGERTLAIRTSITLSTSLHYSGRGREAVALIEDLLPRLSPTAEPLLHFMANHNLLFYLPEVGEARRAFACLNERIDLYRSIRDRFPLAPQHFHWVSGRILRPLGRLPEAAKHLTVARDGFTRKNHPYEAIRASLDLALVYIDEGNHDALLDLAGLLAKGPLLDENLDREALSAVRLIVASAEKEALEARMVRSVSQFLEVSSGNPSLVFAEWHEE